MQLGTYLGFKGQGQKSWHTKEPILEVQYGGVTIEQDLYLYEGVVERLERPKHMNYQTWAYMRATAVHGSTVPTVWFATTYGPHPWFSFLIDTTLLWSEYKHDKVYLASPPRHIPSYNVVCT